MVDLGPRPSAEDTDFKAAKQRINSKLELLRSELKSMHEQDVTLLRTLMNIHFTISALGGRGGGGGGFHRSDSNSSLYTPSGAATPVSGTQSPMLPFKNRSSLTAPAFPLQRMFSAPTSRAGSYKYGSMHSSASSSICGDDEDEPLGWSYNSTASDCAPLAWSLDIEHLETHLSSVLTPVPEAFRRLRNHPENQPNADATETTTQSSSLAIMVCKPDQKPEFRVEHVTADEIGSLVLPVCGNRGSTGHSDFLSFVVDNTILNEVDDDDLDDVMEKDEDVVAKKAQAEKQVVEKLEEVNKPVVMETSTVSFTVNGQEDQTSPLQSPTSPISAMALHFPRNPNNWNIATQSHVVNGHAIAYKEEEKDSPKPSVAEPEDTDDLQSPIIHVKDVIKRWQKKDEPKKKDIDTKKEPMPTSKPSNHVAKDIKAKFEESKLPESQPKQQEKPITTPKWKAPRPFVKPLNLDPQPQTTEDAHKQSVLDKHVNEPFPNELTLCPSPPPQPTQHKRSFSGNVGRLLGMFQSPDSSATSTSPIRKRLTSTDRSCSIQDLCSASSPRPIDSPSMQELRNRLGGPLSASISNLASGANLSEQQSPTSPFHTSQSATAMAGQQDQKFPPVTKPKTFLAKTPSIDPDDPKRSLYGSNFNGDNPIARKNRSMMLVNQETATTPKVTSQVEIPFTPPVTKPSQLPRQGTPMRVSVSTPSRGIKHFEIPLKTQPVSDFVETSPSSSQTFKSSVIKTSTLERRIGTPPREITLTPTSVNRDLRSVPLSKMLGGDSPSNSANSNTQNNEISVDMNQNQKDCQNGQTIKLDGTKTSSIQLFL